MKPSMDLCASVAIVGAGLGTYALIVAYNWRHSFCSADVHAALGIKPRVALLG